MYSYIHHHMILNLPVDVPHLPLYNLLYLKLDMAPLNKYLQ
jgi:hypothetical protein